MACKVSEKKINKQNMMTKNASADGFTLPFPLANRKMQETPKTPPLYSRTSFADCMFFTYSHLLKYL
jgi:hypothetical protein